MSADDRLSFLERKVFAMEVTLEQISERLEKQDQGESTRHTELKILIENNSIQGIIKNNIKWLFLIVLAASSGANGIAKIIELLPQLVK